MAFTQARFPHEHSEPRGTRPSGRLRRGQPPRGARGQLVRARSRQYFGGPDMHRSDGGCPVARCDRRTPLTTAATQAPCGRAGMVEAGGRGVGTPFLGAAATAPREVTGLHGTRWRLSGPFRRTRKPVSTCCHPTLRQGHTERMQRVPCGPRHLRPTAKGEH